VSDVEHLGWRISALIDGELTTVEEEVALDHLASCERCQEEMAEITAARTLVRQLGEVEPPDDYLERALFGGRSRSSARLGLVGLVTLAAAWVAILAIGFSVSLPDVQPAVDELADQHETVTQLARDSDRLPARTDHYEQFTSAEVAGLGAPYAAPDSLDSALSRIGAYGKGPVVQLFYSDGSDAISLFEEEGTLDWSALPAGGEEVDVGDGRGWIGATTTDPPQNVLVVPKGAVVYTLVSQLPKDDLIAVAAELPEPDAFSLSERARRNFDELVRRFGLGTTAAEAEDPAPTPAAG
jgi:Putative zinc-finger